MKAFQYAAPPSEAGVLELLSAEPGHTEILAGGTDLIGLMKKMLVTPERIVNIKEVRSLRGVSADSAGVTIGAVTNLDDLLDEPALVAYPALTHAIAAMNSPQLQAQGTIGGDLLQFPRCWYFRNGYSLADSSRLIPQGASEQHAIFANHGPAKFVSASRLAPPLMALGASVRIAGPAAEDEVRMPVDSLFRIPRADGERPHELRPNQLLTHIYLPPVGGAASATYEIAHGVGPDFPLVSASAVVRIQAGVVTEAAVVLGQVAPIPWRSSAAAQAILGRPVTTETAEAAGEAAVANATPLDGNRYKVQLAKVAVKRALLAAAGLPTGGF